MEFLIKSKVHGNHTVFIDDVDSKLIESYYWHLAKAKSGFYVCTAIKTYNGKKKTVCLHDMILKKPIGFTIDHKDRNKLNNRRDNLRIATYAQNRVNTVTRKQLLGQYRGVSFHSHSGKFRAYIGVERKHIHLGLFEKAIDAAVRYNEEAVKLFGEFAILNNINYPTHGTKEISANIGSLQESA